MYATRLICNDTIEERIEQILERKKILFEEVVDELADASLERVLSGEELFGLFWLTPPRMRREGTLKGKAEVPSPPSRPERPRTEVIRRGERSLELTYEMIERRLVGGCHDATLHYLLSDGYQGHVVGRALCESVPCNQVVTVPARTGLRPPGCRSKDAELDTKTAPEGGSWSGRSDSNRRPPEPHSGEGFSDTAYASPLSGQPS